MFECTRQNVCDRVDVGDFVCLLENRHKTPPTLLYLCSKVRMLAASGPVSRAIAAELKKGGPGTSEAAARRAYQALWPSKAKLQRDFHVFGGEFLMAQQAPILRGFFNGFFKLPLPLWAVRKGGCDSWGSF